MPFNEELLADNRNRPAFQEDNLSEFCAGIEQRLRDAPGKEAALRIVDERCDAFSRSCESSILRSQLRNHITALWKSIWESTE